MNCKNPASLCEAGDGMQLGDAKEGKDKASSLAKRASERGRHWLASCRMKGATGEAKEMRRQGPSEGDVGEGESREYKKGTSERRGLYLCGARSGAVRRRESDGAPYPIGRAAKPGGCDSVFCITDGKL